MRQAVVIVAGILILSQLVLRGWAIAGGWFYGDDLKFLSQAATEPLSWDFLFARHQQQLMPGGLLIVWLVGQGAAFSWSLAAASILLMQTLANLACAFMLVRLFGVRPAILFPLSLYLFSPLTLGAFMWWAAALNQIPLQIVFFLLIATHVEYLRTKRLRLLAISLTLFAIGLLFYIKAVVMLPILVYVSIAYFARGRINKRILFTLRTAWSLWLSYGILVVGYLAIYVHGGESPVGGSRDSAYLETFDRQMRETLGPALVGGPWRWLDPGRQDVLSHAPEFAVTLAWIVLTAVVVMTIRTRFDTWRAWLMLALYLIPTGFLTANGRASLFGPDVGLYVRYLSDVSVVACLALACATMSLSASRVAQPPRSDAGSRLRPWIGLGCALFLIGSLWSTVTYAQFWHQESPAERFVAGAQTTLAPIKSVDIIDSPVPDEFVLKPNAPFNRPSRLLAPLHTKITPVTYGTDLEMFRPDGTLASAVVIPGITSATINNDCGTLIKATPTRTIRLENPTTNEKWWMSINYSASDSGHMIVNAGSTSRRYPIERGPHTLFVRTTGTYDSVTITILNNHTALCVSKIMVGFIGTFS